MVPTLEQGTELIPGYRLVGRLGRGGFGEVWEVEAPGALRKAIKIVPMHQGRRGLKGREFEGLQRVRNIRHPYLLSIERFDVIDGDLVVIMELAEQNLADRFEECVREGLPGIPRSELLKYLGEVAEALDFLNQNHGLQHLDVKPENIFLCGGHAKIGDFGLVQPQHTVLVDSAIAISPPYAPPELFDGKIENSIDQYSLAVTYQEMLTGTRPFDADGIRQLIRLHLQGKPDLHAVPVGDRGVLMRAFQQNPSQRFSNCQEFVEALERALVFGAPPFEPAAARRPSATTGRIGVRTGGDECQSPRSASQSTRKRKETVAVHRGATTTSPLGPDPGDAICPEGTDQVRSTFVAYLPKTVFAHKLRGFIDAMRADIVHCSDDAVVLKLRQRGWKLFGARNNVFVEIDTCCKKLNSDSRVVDVRVWGSGPNIDAGNLGRRAVILIACLKSFFICDSRGGVLNTKNDALRAAIVG